MTSRGGAVSARWAVAVALMWSLVSAGLSGAEEPVRDVVWAGSVLKAMAQRYEAVPSLTFFAKRSLQRENERRQDQWTLHLRRPHDLRIEYSADTTRTIIVNREEMWEYVPEARRALRTDLRRMPEIEKQRLLGQCMSRIAIDGLRVGAYEQMLSESTRVRKCSGTEPAVWMIEGDAPKFLLRVEPERGVLLESRLYREGKLFLSTQADRFVHAGNDLYLPSVIRGTHIRGEERVEWTVSLRGAKAGEPLSDELFRFRAPKGVTVIDKSDALD